MSWSETKQSKSSEIAYPVLEWIRQRRSGRAFDPKPVEAEKINALFEAARWAPSSMNEQPWAYIYATKAQADVWGSLFDALLPSNQVWVKDAPLLVLSLARKEFYANGGPNAFALYDLGAANSLLSIQATGLGLNVHQMGGYDPLRARENLNIPDSFDLGVFMAIGYPGDAGNLPDNLKVREAAPRMRLLQSEFVRTSGF